MTTVVNLKTRAQATYSLDPVEAVQAAYIQFELKDFSTWSYEKRKAAMPVLVYGEHSVACGDWTATIKPS